MNALFYFSGYNFQANVWESFCITVPDGPHDRYEMAKAQLIEAYPYLSKHSWRGRSICLTTQDVWEEL